MSSTYFKQMWINHFGRAIEKNCSVKYLNLSNCSLGKLNLSFFGDSIGRNKCIETIDISSNKFDSGWEVFCLSFVKSENKSLKNLIATYNSISILGI